MTLLLAMEAGNKNSPTSVQSILPLALMKVFLSRETEILVSKIWNWLNFGVSHTISKFIFDDTWRILTPTLSVYFEKNFLSWKNLIFHLYRILRIMKTYWCFWQWDWWVSVKRQSPVQCLSQSESQGPVQNESVWKFFSTLYTINDVIRA